MLPAWMVYATVIGVLAAVTALALEHLVGIWSLPRRGVWIAAMIVAIVAPIWLATRTPARVATRPPQPRTAVASAVGLAGARLERRMPWRIRAYRWSIRFDRRARTTWIASSGIVALALGVAYASMLRRQRAWRHDTLLGHRVLTTTDIGPAVVGFVWPRIVIPEWALALPDRERRLMLEHELQHLSAGDPKLLLFAGLIVILFPWNVALWFMTQRLRLAIEIDCDARVVHGTDEADEYGLFLLAVGERRAHGFYLAASLAERRSSLERRIHAMTMLRPRHPILASLPFAALAFGATALAAQTPTPPASAGAGGFVRAAAVAPPADRIQLSQDQMRALLTARHPDIASGKSEDNLLTVVLASNGEVVLSGTSRVSIARSSGAGGSAGRVASGGGAVARLAPTAATATATGGDAGAPTPVVVKKAEGFGAGAGAASGFATFPGVGNIDRSLIKDQYRMAFDAGQVSAGTLIVVVVTLTGNSTSE